MSKQFISMRDIRITTSDGREIAVDGEIAETAEAEPVTFSTVSGEVTFSAPLGREAARWLNYRLNVRPWLYCPVERRLN